MVGERLSDLEFSWETFLGTLPETFLSVIYLVIAIAIYAVIIWHFYRFIARRDCFKISTTRYPKVVGFLKYFFAFPFVAFLFFMVFAVLMSFLTRGIEEEVILSTSFALVLAIRITAYYNEDLSKDVAKMLPFAMLGIFLIDPSYFDFGAIEDKVLALPSLFTNAIQYIILITIIEWIFRTLLTIRYAIFPKKQVVSAEE